MRKKPLFFSNANLARIVSPHDDALVVTLAAANHNLHYIMIDTGSSMDLLHLLAFEKMGIDKKKVATMSSPLVGFGGEQV